MRDLDPADHLIAIGGKSYAVVIGDANLFFVAQRLDRRLEVFMILRINLHL